MKRDELESSELQETPWPRIEAFMFGPRDDDDDNADEYDDADAGDEDADDEFDTDEDLTMIFIQMRPQSFNNVLDHFRKIKNF